MGTNPGHIFALLLVALLATAATTAYDQAMAPTNSLPNPYRSVENLGQAAGRADLGLNIGGRHRCRRQQRLGRRAVRRVRAAEPDGAAVGGRQALCLRGLEP